jgi:hypothetical protein
MFRQGIGEPAQEGNLLSYTITDLIVELQTFLGELSARALKDRLAAETLYVFARIACEDLWEICVRKPDVIAPAARKKMVFPCAWPLLRKHQEKVRSIIKSLRVGENAIFRLHGRKQFDPDKPVNRIVIQWVERISHMQAWIRSEQNRQRELAALTGSAPDIPQARGSFLKLKRLSTANADKWAKVIWQGIVIASHGHPETDGELREKGKFRAGHTYTRQEGEGVSRTEEANIRDGIRQRVVKAVHDLAAAASAKRV